MREILMMRGARILVETCAGLQPGERAVIVTDAERDLTIATLLAAAVLERGGEPVVCVMPPRPMDGMEPAAPVAAAMAAADVVFMPTSRSIAHAHATKVAVQHGARALSMTAFTPDMMYEGGLLADFAKQKPICDEVARRLGAARRAHLTTRGGTDLRLNLEGRPGNSHACIVRPGEFSAVPNIEANISPLEGSAEGVIVVDGSIPNFGIGLIPTPIRLTVKAGNITAIEGGDQARRLEDLLRGVGESSAYNIAQLAVGLNPECRRVTGVMLNDHGCLGTVHLGIGTSANLGGVTKAPIHYDAILLCPTLRLDESTVMEAGELRL